MVEAGGGLVAGVRVKHNLELAAERLSVTDTSGQEILGVAAAGEVRATYCRCKRNFAVNFTIFNIQRRLLMLTNNKPVVLTIM